MTEPQLLPVPLGMGLDESFDDAATPPQIARVCENVVFDGSDVAIKRNGLSVVNDGFVAQRLFSRGNEVLYTDGVSAFSLMTGRNVGRVSPCMVTRQLLASANWTRFYPTQPLVPLVSFAEDPSTKLQVRAWNDGHVISVKVVDPATEIVISSTALNDTAGTGTGKPLTQPRVIILASVAFVLYWDQAFPTKIRYQALDLTSPSAAWTAAANVGAIVMSTTAVWDATPIAGIAALAVMVGINNAPVVYTINASGTTLTAGFSATVETIGGSPSAIRCCAVLASFTDGIVVTYSYETASGSTTTYLVRWAAYDVVLVPVQAATTVSTGTYTRTGGFTVASGSAQYLTLGILRTATGTGNTQQYLITATRVFYIGQTTPGSFTDNNDVREVPAYFGIVIKKTTPTSITEFGPLLGFQCMSKPFGLTINGTFTGYMLAQFSDGLRETQAQTAVTNASPTLVLLNVLSGAQFITTLFQQPCAVMAPGFAGDSAPCTADVAIRTDGLAVTIPGWEQDVAGATSASALACDWKSPALWQSVSLGAWTWLAGGMPITYDGSATSEVGFVHPPPKPLVQAVTGSGTYTLCETLQIIAVYSWQDNNGNVHRSAPSQPSDPIDCTTGCTGLIYATVFPMRCTLRTNGNSAGDLGPHPIKIDFYRNSALTPDAWQYVSSTPSDPNNVGVIAFQIDPSLSAADPMTSAELPTTGGIVESDAPPNLSGLSVHADRVCGIDEDGRTMWFTTTLTPGECPRFSDAFTLAWPDGPITATWSLEQRLHAATKDATYFVIGDGPTDTDIGVDWTTPQKWQFDLGVVDPRGVCLFQGGALLNTRKGLYVQGRDGSMSWFGQRIQRTYAANPVVTSMSALTSDGVIRISLQPAEGQGQTGVVVHFDHRNNKIAKHVYPASVGMLSSVVADGAIYMLSSAANSASVYAEAADYIDPGNAWIVQKVQTGWVNVGGPMQAGGEGVLGLVLARRSSRAGLKVSTTRDYGTTLDANAPSLTDAQIEAFTSLPVVQLRASLGTQTIEAVSFTVEDVAPVDPADYGTGQGHTFISLLVRSMPKRGEFKELQNGANQ